MPGGCGKVSKSHVKVQKVGILTDSCWRFSILLRGRLVVVFNSLECNLLSFVKCRSLCFSGIIITVILVYFSLTAIALTGRLLEPIPPG